MDNALSALPVAESPAYLTWLADNSQWVIPVILLALQTVYKLFVFERGSVSKTWAAALHLPVDICFLSIALVAAFMLMSADMLSANLSMLLIYMILAVVSVLLWKLCPSGYTKGELAKASVATLFNLALTITMLYAAVGLYARQS